jgi:FMN phosphatase YigB (HAD superfamily)
MDYQTIIFDFDGVLCQGRLYEKTLLPDHRETYDWIQSNIFGNEELFHKWMRGQVDSAGINKIISENTKIEHEALEKLYRESVSKMVLEENTRNLVKSLKLSRKKVGIVSNNVDAFTQITIPSHNLDSIFDVIINSADHGLLKVDENGKLFDIALSVLGSEINNCLLIDDSESAIDLFRKKGGYGFLYNDFKELNSFLSLD